MHEHIEIRTLPSIAAGRACGGRPSQQDQIVCLRDEASGACLLVVADGMGGDGAGELASEGVAEVAARMWELGHWRRQPGPLFLEALCQDAHAELRQRGESLAAGRPHSTVVALLMRGQQAYWAHVGDSRLYRFQGLRCLGCTEDHSVAQAKLRRGETSHEALGDDPDQHLLLRGLGGAQPPRVDHGCGILRPGQTFALCSDGVWERLGTDELARLAARADQRGAVEEALALAVQRGGDTGDNVALILARFGWRAWLREQGASAWSSMSGRRRVVA